MGLFNKKSDKSDIDAIIANVYGGNSDDVRTAQVFNSAGFTADQTRQSLTYLHGASNLPDFSVTQEQVKKMTMWLASQLTPCYNSIKEMYPHPSLREELITMFSLLSAASTEIDSVLIDALNTVMLSDKAVISKEYITAKIMDMRLSDLIHNKKYSDEQAVVFQMYNHMGRNSKYISGLLTSKMSKKEQRNIFNLFAMLLMGVGGIMANGNTNSLFYTVLNNILLDYYEVISMWDKKGVPNDCWDYLKMVNIKMHEYD